MRELKIVNRENTTFSISVDWVGDAVTLTNWDIVIFDSFIEPYSDVDARISEIPHPEAIWAYWISIEDEEITLHFSARYTEASE